MMLILASNSPRRRELLARLGWQASVRPADIDEDELPGETPADYVLRLAAEKCAVVARQVPPAALILAADTTVVLGEGAAARILAKPADPAEARAMLTALRAGEHRVLTGVAAARGGAAAPLLDLVETRVTMRPYTDAEIDTYIASGDPFDKAGGYAIQHRAFHPVAALTGCYTNIVGLPLCRAVRLLRQLGAEPPPNFAAYPCLSDPEPAVCSFLP
jgi:septum formation protein